MSQIRKKSSSSSKMIKVLMTEKQARMLGIVFCRHCGHPPNNHFEWDNRPCAHCHGKCPGYEQVIRLPTG